MYQVTYTAPGTYTWTCPVDIRAIYVMSWAGGAGGSNGSPAGGGGGEFAGGLLSVTPGADYEIVVGVGGIVGGGSGGESHFTDGASLVVRAYGGFSNIGGSGGTGDVHYDGGGGGSMGFGDGGGAGGGGAGGPSGAGSAGASPSGNTGGAGGAGNPGGQFGLGYGGHGGTVGAGAAQAGYQPGGGGGAGYIDGTNGNGADGVGGDGIVVLYDPYGIVPDCVIDNKKGPRQNPDYPLLPEQVQAELTVRQDEAMQIRRRGLQWLFGQVVPKAHACWQMNGRLTVNGRGSDVKLNGC